MSNLRTCKQCGLEKDVSSFPTNHHLYRHPSCKVCKNAYQRKLRAERPEIYLTMGARRRAELGFKEIAAARNKQWYQKDLETSRVNARRKAKSGREFINDLKHGRACADCGISYPTHMLDFDHVHGEKIANVSKMRNWNQEKILAEIAKCDIVCANCHRDRTHKRRYHVKQSKAA